VPQETTEFWWDVLEDYALETRNGPDGPSPCLRLGRGELSCSPESVVLGTDMGFRRYAPLRRDPALFLNFSELRSPDDVLAFAREYGHLGLLRFTPEEHAEFWNTEMRTEPFESCDLWLREAELMRDAIASPRSNVVDPVARERVQRAVNRRIANVEPRLLRDAGGTLTLRLWPRSLLDALWLQFAQSLHGIDSFEQCARQGCGRWFQLAPQAKRRTAKYCSPACRNRAWRDRKRGDAGQQ
jgi:hypothetical protein